MATSKVELRDGMVVRFGTENYYETGHYEWAVDLTPGSHEVKLTLVSKAKGAIAEIGATHRRDAGELLSEIEAGELVIVSTPPEPSAPVQLYRRDLKPGDRFAYGTEWEGQVFEVVGSCSDRVIQSGYIRDVNDRKKRSAVCNVIRSPAQPAAPDDSARYAAAAAESTQRTLDQVAAAAVESTCKELVRLLAADKQLLRRYEAAQVAESIPAFRAQVGAVDYARAQQLFTRAVKARIAARTEQRQIATAVRCEGAEARENEFDE